MVALGLVLVIGALVLWWLRPSSVAPPDPATDQAQVAEEPPVDPGLSLLPGEVFTGDLPAMRERGFVRALVTHSLTDFFVSAGQLKGIQAEFLREYEKFLNAGVKREHEKVRVLFVPVTFDELIPALQSGRGDIAAAFLTITPQRERRVDFASGRSLSVREVLVTGKNAPPLRSIDDLAGREIYVLRGSSYAEHLAALNEQFRERGLAPIAVQEADPRLLSEDILEMVNAGVIEATVVDDYKARLWAQTLHNIQVQEDIVIAADTHVGWAIRKDSPELKASLKKFLAKAQIGTLLGNVLFKRYFEDTRWIENPLGEAERRRYDRYLKLFEKYGERYGLDPLALVAQAFKESGLDNDRHSHRGAVGLMQLLPSTASGKHVGIADIKTPENNIHAGAKYLAFIRERYFSDSDLTDVDRLAFTWAAYNAGPAKVLRMRALAEEMGRDPNRWFGNVEVAAGKIVGRETVKYVADVYKYYIAYQLIAKLDNAKGQPTG